MDQDESGKIARVSSEVGKLLAYTTTVLTRANELSNKGGKMGELVVTIRQELLIAIQHLQEAAEAATALKDEYI